MYACAAILQMRSLEKELNRTCTTSCMDGLTVYSVLYMVAQASRTHSCLNRFFEKSRMKKQNWKSIVVCRISAPSMRKMHFSSFLVHWLGPGGKTLRVWCRTFFRSSPFLMCSLLPALKDTQMLGLSTTQMKDDAVILFYKKTFTLGSKCRLGLLCIVQMIYVQNYPSWS